MSIKLHQKRLEQLTFSDIEELVSSQTTESHWLEFKRNLWLPSEGKGGNNDPVIRVSKELVAFANAGGGTLILGLSEKEKAASALDPIEGAAEKLDRLMRSLNDPTTIDPPLGYIDSALIAVPEARGQVIILRVGSSLNKPHRACKDQNRVYVRRGEESRPIAMNEIKDLVLFNEYRGNRVRDRLDQMLNDYFSRNALGSDQFVSVVACAPVEPLPFQIDLDYPMHGYRLIKISETLREAEEYGSAHLKEIASNRMSASLIGGRLYRTANEEMAAFVDGSMWAGSTAHVNLDGQYRKINGWEVAANCVRLFSWLGTVLDRVGEGKANLAVQMTIQPAKDCLVMFGHSSRNSGRTVNQLQKTPIYHVGNSQDLDSVVTALWHHMHEAMDSPDHTRASRFRLERV